MEQYLIWCYVFCAIFLVIVSYLFPPENQNIPSYVMVFALSPIFAPFILIVMSYELYHIIKEGIDHGKT